MTIGSRAFAIALLTAGGSSFLAGQTTLTYDVQASQFAVATGILAAAGQGFTISASGTVNIADEDGPYITDADGTIVTAPPPGSGAYDYFTNQAAPVGTPPSVGSMKFLIGHSDHVVNGPYGALVAGFSPSPNATMDSDFPTGFTLVGTSGSVTAPAGGGYLYFAANDWALTDNAGSFTVNILLPLLSVTKTHAANFTQGQANAQYTVNVTNNGAGPTSGQVTVADTIPTGLTLVSMSGTGWSCVSSSCTRSDLLPAGQMYPAITVTVNVAPNATSPLVNQVMVSGGGSASASTNDSTTIVPPPVLTSLNPASATVGGLAFTLTVNGNNFLSGASVQWNGSGLSTTFVNAGQLTAAVPASLIATAGSAMITVVSGGITSNSLSFPVNNQAPLLTSLSPASATAGGAAFTLTVNGNNLLSGASVQWNGSGLSTTFVNAGQLTAAVPASLIATAGSAMITVVSGGITSNSLSFPVNNPTPVLTSLIPTTATAGGPAFSLTVNGSGFLSGASVQWNGLGLSTTFVNAGQLTAAVPASLIATAGSAMITVVSGGITSNSLSFPVNNPTPVLTSLIPTTATAGGPAFSLTVNGSGFLSGASVQWNGSGLSTTFVNAGQLTAAAPASLIATAGSAMITVVSGGITSNSLSFPVNNQAPLLTSLSPASATAGGAAFTLTVNGSGFLSGASVQWNGSGLSTTFVNAGQLTAAVPASLIAGAGSAMITVVSGGITSSGLSFPVTTGCSLRTFDPGALTFGPGGGSGTVNFNAGCPWSITGNPSWITLPASSGTGPSFGFNIQPNPGATRQATLSINGGGPGLTVAIAQTGLVCTYKIANASGSASASFLSSGGMGTINVVAPAGCPWTATPSQSFITISGNASGSGNGGVNYTVAPDASSNPQAGSITIAGLAYVINEQPPGSQANSCSISSPAPPPIRAEGYSERVADAVFTCEGQAPSGGLIGDVLITFNTGITNSLLNTGQTDALLLGDEPTAANLALGTNAFRGLLSAVNGTEGILFPGVQLASASGGTFQHTWRITNARVNAQTLAPGTGVQATISITAPAPFAVISQPVVAYISSPSTFSAGGSSGAKTSQVVAFNEGFATAFEPRLAANQDPSQVGTVYNSESGYVNSAKLGAQTGFATSGTRLILVLGNVPPGVSVIAPVASASGPSAVLVSADSTGAGGSPVSGTSHLICPIAPAVNCPSSVTATWEVTASDPNSIETVTFNLIYGNPNNVLLSGITYAGAIAPVSSGAAPQLPSTNLPVPRFASSTVTIVPPATVSLSVAPQESVMQPGLKSSSRSETSTPSSSAVGGTVTWTQIQANTGAAAASTAPNVSVGGTLPPTWVLLSCTAVDSGGVCPTIDPNNPSNSYTATYPSLSPGQTGTIVLTAQSGSQTSGAVEYTATIDSDLSNSDPTAGSFTTNFPVAQIGLNVTLTHAANFSQGQAGAQYSVVVANGGSIPTSLPVTVTEILPPSLTLVSMAGVGWTCTLSTSSCIRSDALAANSPFPSITVTVNVASNAPGSVTNQVVAATGVLQATGSDVTNINPVVGGPPAAFFNGQASLGSNVYYLAFPDGNLFGYYSLQFFPIVYHYDLGFEAFVDGGNGGAYLYDFTSSHWFFTSPSLFPYLYDFTLNSWLYYFPDTKNPGHYTANPRFFSNLTTGKIVTM